MLMAIQKLLAPFDTAKEVTRVYDQVILKYNKTTNKLNIRHEPKETTLEEEVG